MWEVLLMSENSLQPIRYAIQIWVEMSRQYEISVVVPQTPFFLGGGGGERGRGTSGGGGVQNVGCFAQANYFTISLTYYFILQQCLIWLHQYVSQIYFDQLYEISFSKVHHVDFPLLLKGKIERHETVSLKKTHIAIKPRSYTC